MKDSRFNEYLNQFRNGEVKGLCEIYYEYYKKIYGSAIIIVRNKVLAEDVASNVFVNIVEYSLKNKNYINHPGAWIYQITKNAAIRLLTEEHINHKVEFSEELFPDMYLPISDAEFSMDFYRAIETLSEKYKEYAILHYIYELKYKHIAEKFGVTIKSVERCFDNIRTYLKRYFKT